jgi:hypothetical protein
MSNLMDLPPELLVLVEKRGGRERRGGRPRRSAEKKSKPKTADQADSPPAPQPTAHKRRSSGADRRKRIRRAADRKKPRPNRG